MSSLKTYLRNWQVTIMHKVTLGDVAREFKDTYKGSKAGMPVVGLEHLIPQEMKLTAWDGDKDNTFTKMFRKGHVLFGRRRAYLKKAAVAPFDGICSGDITVVEAIPSKIVPELLPFIIQNDHFFDYAVGKSAGSLSPRVKWEHLAEYEFVLPSIEEQKNLSEVLWAFQDTKDAYKKLLTATDELVKSQFIEMFGDPAEKTNQWQTMTLQEILDYGWVTYHLDGNHGGEYPKSEEFVLAGVPYISANCIVDGQITFSNAKYVTPERAKRFRKGIAQDEDVLFAHNATVGPVSILHTKEPTVILGTSLTAYRCNKGYLLPAYLKAYMESWAFVEQYESEMQQTTRKQVPITTQRKYKFVVPPIELQGRFSAFVEQTDKSKFGILQYIIS